MQGRAVFNSDELAKFRDAFQQVDQDRDGVIGTGDLDRMMKRLGLPVGQAVLQSMIAEVDSNRNGVVDFNEFLEVSGCFILFRPHIFSYYTKSCSLRHPTNHHR